MTAQARDDSTIESLPTTGQRPALIQDFPVNDITISIITAHELIVGARSQRDADGINSLIKAFPLHVELGAQITVLAYELLRRYAKSDGLRTFDALIAATAIEEGLTLVSKNRKHFQMISELSLEVPGY